MAPPPTSIVLFLALCVSVAVWVLPCAVASGTCNVQLSGGPKRSRFPPDFVFGTATSAFQVEGAALADGKGPSIWDTFTKVPGKIADGSDADVAVDEYHRLKEDIWLMKALGVQSYRFSIAWARVLPDGVGAPNVAGIEYYNKLIDLLIESGITPVATLYHWDLPQALQDRYGGWLDQRIVKDFAAYASLCFQNFGDRVSTWITLNEPQQVTIQGYGLGTFAPGRCSDRARCSAGDSSTEPYIAAHNLLLAHAAAVRVYRENFQELQHGRIGITLDCTFMFPLDRTVSADRSAAQRGMEFQFSWFADPIMNGTYPTSMVQNVGSRLPQFSPAQMALLMGSTDFLGLNYYTSYYASEASPPVQGKETPHLDRHVSVHDVGTDGRPIGPTAASPWLKVVPRGVYFMLKWIHKRYPELPILITENGISQAGNLPVPVALCDKERIAYHRDHLSYILMAIKKGVPVHAYYAWSLVDNFEWAAGYSERFGIHYVDFSDDDLTRIPKASAIWWRRFLSEESLPSKIELRSSKSKQKVSHFWSSVQDQ